MGGNDQPRGRERWTTLKQSPLSQEGAEEPTVGQVAAGNDRNLGKRWANKWYVPLGVFLFRCLACALVSSECIHNTTEMANNSSTIIYVWFSAKRASQKNNTSLRFYFRVLRLRTGNAVVPCRSWLPLSRMLARIDRHFQDRQPSHWLPISNPCSRNYGTGFAIGLECSTLGPHVPLSCCDWLVRLCGAVCACVLVPLPFFSFLPFCLSLAMRGIVFENDNRASILHFAAAGKRKVSIVVVLHRDGRMSAELVR